MSSRGRTLVVLLLIGLLVVPGNAVAFVRGSPDLSVSVGDNTFTPGSNAQLQLTVTNEGDVDAGSTRNPSLHEAVTTARGVDVRLVAEDAPVEITTRSRSLGRLPRGGAAPLGYGLSIDEDAEPGTYTLEAIVEYRYTSWVSEETGARDQDTESRRFDVTIRIDDRARFEIVSTTTDARVGSSGTVSVRMRNAGSEPANETSVALESLNSEATFGHSTTASRYAGEWAPGETRTLEYQVAFADTAEQQRYAFRATTTFEDAEGVTRQPEPLSLGVEPGPEQQFRVVDTSNSVAVGETGTLSVTLENAGSVPVADATVRVQSRSGDLAFGDAAAATRFVGDWAPGETRTVEYDLTATDSAETRSYALSANVTYEDPDGHTGRSDVLPLGVTPAPEQEFSLSNLSTDLRVGEEGTIRGTVTNEGEFVVRNAVVRFETENRHVSPLERTYAVGRLRPGESVGFAFAAEVSDAADVGPRQFAFVVEYRNGDGQARTSDELLTRQRIATGGEAFAVEAVDATYPPGGSGSLTLEVTNTANETLTDVSAVLFADDPVSVNDDEAFFEALAPGESTTVTFGVSTESGTLSKSYPVSVDFQYEDADGDTHVSDSHQVAVRVAESASSGGDGGLPLTAVGIGAVSLVGIGAVLRYRD